MLQIICCESVVTAEPLFQTIGEVTVIPDHELNAAALQHADALIVRSMRKIDHTLLANSSIQFVATATAGYDHLDTSWLEDHKIAWHHAAGCNAESVAEYIVCALLHLQHQTGLCLKNQTLGIIGVGAVGTCVAKKAAILGLNILLNDPPLADQQSSSDWTDLSTLLAQSDIISLHVPLMNQGKHRTYHLADATFFAQTKPGAVFINTARGEVANYTALYEALISKQLSHVVLDVWPHEPQIEMALLKQAIIATPHIAGHSWKGKIQGSWDAYLACCNYFSSPATAVNPLLHLPNKHLRCTELADEMIWSAVTQVYDIEQDSQALKAILLLPQQEQIAAFSRLRKHYAKRMEFSQFIVDAKDCNVTNVEKLYGLGFKAS